MIRDENVYLVTGSREFPENYDGDIPPIIGAMKRGLYEDNLMINGGARGFDTFMQNVANQGLMNLCVIRADWKKHGKAAGPIRNAEMVKMGSHFGYRDCIAMFVGDPFKNRGTMNCVELAMKACFDVSAYILADNGKIYSLFRNTPDVLEVMSHDGGKVDLIRTDPIIPLSTLLSDGLRGLRLSYPEAFPLRAELP